MSLQTVLKKGKDTFQIITQQYEVGLYVAIYRNGSIYEQLSLNKSEQDFHKDIIDNKFFKGKIKLLSVPVLSGKQI